MTFDDFILEQELDDIPSLCDECGRIHGTEACQYDDDTDCSWCGAIAGENCEPDCPYWGDDDEM